MAADYAIRLTRKPKTETEPPHWVAEIPGLPGCVTRGSTAAEAVEAIEAARDFWIAAGLDREASGNVAPDEHAAPPENYSGHLHLRVPRGLHRRLARQSQHQGVSLNQYATFLLARATESSEDRGSAPSPPPQTF